MGSEIRFGVNSENGEQSSIFRMWTNKSDVYISVRSLACIAKVSLHESGHWQYSYTSESISNKNVPNQSRHIEKWERPQNNIANGCTLAFRVVVPRSELRQNNNTVKKAVSWVPNNKPGSLSDFILIFTNSGVNVNGWPGKDSMDTQLLKRILLPNKETIWLVTRNSMITETEIVYLEQKRNELIMGIPEDFNNVTEIHNSLYGIEPDGSRKFIDMVLW